MAKNLLVTINNCEMSIVNDELRKSLTNIVGAEKLSKNSAWITANEYANIFDNELYTDDFENAKEFAGIMGVSAGLVTQYRKAVDFVTSKAIFSANEISVGKAYMLSALGDDVTEFINWCDSNGINILSMSDAGLKKTIKEWKDENKAIDTEADVVEESNDEAVENESSLLDDIIEELSTMNDEELAKVMDYIREVKGL